MEIMQKALWILLLSFTAITLASAADYKIVSTWKLGGDGGWDYLTADSMHIASSSRAPRA